MAHFIGVAGLLAFLVTTHAGDVLAAGQTEPVGRGAGTYQVADLVGDECKLWNKACSGSCNGKVPKVVTGGAVVGGASPNAPHSAFQRAQMLRQCQVDCMKAYPLCK